jgi:DNA (cytosine-5)-methyltransferase 1
VPQNRERIFLIGFLDHEAYLRFSFAPKQKLEKRLKDVLEIEVDEKYYLKDSAIAHCGNQEPKTQVPSATKCGYELAESGDSINLSIPNSTTRRGRVGKQVAQTLDTQCNQAVVTNHIRKLTPLECWRLQDFSDEAHNKAKAAGVSQTQLYKQAGNSMSVNVLEMIFRQIINGKNSDSLF